LGQYRNINVHTEDANPAPNISSGKHVQFAIENDHLNIYFVDLPSYSFSVVMLYPLIYRIENADVPSFFWKRERVMGCLLSLLPRHSSIRDRRASCLRAGAKREQGRPWNGFGHGEIEIDQRKLMLNHRNTGSS